MVGGRAVAAAVRANPAQHIHKLDKSGGESVRVVRLESGLGMLRQVGDSSYDGSGSGRPQTAMVCPTREAADHKRRWSVLHGEADHKNRWSALHAKRQTTNGDGLPYTRSGRPQKPMVCPTARWSALLPMVCPTRADGRKKRSDKYSRWSCRIPSGKGLARGCRCPRRTCSWATARRKRARPHRRRYDCWWLWH